MTWHTERGLEYSLDTESDVSLGLHENESCGILRGEIQHLNRFVQCPGVDEGERKQCILHDMILLRRNGQPYVTPVCPHLKAGFLNDVAENHVKVTLRNRNEDVARRQCRQKLMGHPLPRRLALNRRLQRAQERLDLISNRGLQIACFPAWVTDHLQIVRFRRLRFWPEDRIERRDSGGNRIGSTPVPEADVETSRFVNSGCLYQK